jgi:hypothetical protein
VSFEEGPFGGHVVICGDATDAEVLSRAMQDEAARLVLTDVPHNGKIARNVKWRDHREFPMASGEKSGSEFQAFNAAWMKACLLYVQDGGLLGTFIDWRGYPAVDSAALQRG